jgi:hypothetical protein
MGFFGKLLIAVGALLLVHAGYYSVQCTRLISLFRLVSLLGSLTPWLAHDSPVQTSPT